MASRSGSSAEGAPSTSRPSPVCRVGDENDGAPPLAGAHQGFEGLAFHGEINAPDGLACEDPPPLVGRG